MKKVFLTLTMLLFAFMGTMKAVEVEIGTPTGTNNYLPTYTYYNYSLTQQIYTADEIGRGGVINSIGFTMANGDDRTRAINLFMKNVTRNTFENNTDWELFDEGDAVFSGEVTFSVGLVTITLDTPFEYNGTDNLLVCVQDATGSYEANPQFNVFSSPGAAMRAYRDESIYPVNHPDATGTILNVKNCIVLDIEMGPAHITANPASIDMGMRPNGAWMAPFTVELNNSGRPATVSTVTPSNTYFDVDVNVPFEVVNGEPVEFEITTGTGTAGAQEGNIVVTYTDNRSTTIIPISATAYNPVDGDVWENALEITEFPYENNAPAGIYKNYDLAGAADGAIDAMYKVILDRDALLTATTTGANGVAKLYAEDFNGEPGPMEGNTYQQGGGNQMPPVDTWFYYSYTDGETFFGTSTGGGFMWGYQISPENLAGLGHCYLTQVEAAAREAYPYNLYVLRGGDNPGEAEMVYYQEMGENAEALHFFTMDLDAPFAIGEDQNLWVLFYSASPYAAYCGKVPTDPEQAKIWYTLDGETWNSNETYTPIISLHLQYPEPEGGAVEMNLADMSIKPFHGNGTLGETRGNVTLPVHKNVVAPRNRDANDMIYQQFVPAGAYYLAMASTDEQFGVSVSTEDVPLPIQASNIWPEDGTTGVDNGDMMTWTLGDYTSEFQILLGTQFPPTTVLVDWTDYLYQSYEFENLVHNKTYFMQINERNSTGTTVGEIIGFTTVIDGVASFTVENDKLYPGDAAVFSWETERAHRGFNLYKDGVKVNETPITGNTYSVEGLEYNMEGYSFQLTSLYDEGESEPTEPIIVYMTGLGSVNGHVWEMDSITPVYNAMIELVGLDEYGIEQTISLNVVTNPSGYFEGEALAGTFQGVAIKEAYQANPSEEFVIENNTLTADVNIYALEDWAPLGNIKATEQEDNVFVEWSWDPAELFVDFETGDFSQAEFDNEISNYPWAITPNSYEGSYAMKSTCEGVASASSAIQVTVEVPYDGKMGFWVKVSSESNYDKFHFYIDGTEQGQALSGSISYTYKEYAVTEGTHTYKWEYAKDSSVNSGDDCAYIDNITMYRQDIPVPPTPGATTYDFEDSSMMGWTTIDADGDGYTWMVASTPMATGYGHNGSTDCVLSMSYYQGAVLNPDNYMVSPSKMAVQNGASISFWACAQDAAYASEHFGVAVSTGSNSNANDFNTIQEWTMTAKGTQGTTAESVNDMRGTREQGTWYQYTVDLSSYAGQEIWVALRHFNCSDWFYLDVDDITLNDGSAKGTRQDRTLQKFYLYRRNNFAEGGDTIVENLGSFGSDVFNYTDTQWSNLGFGEYQWGIQAYYEGNHHYPEKGRETLTYDFEDNTMMGWTSIDADGDGFDWGLGSDLMSGFTGHDGSYEIVTSQSYDFDAGALNPDNYLVSPAKAEYSQISFWACAQDAAYPAEHFGVAVSTTTATASAFSIVQEWTMTAKSSGTSGLSRNGDIRTMGTWYQFTVDLSAYAGQEIWVAIRHFGCSDMFYLDVDDITLSTEGGVTPPTPPTPGTGGTLTIDFETGNFNQYDFNNNVSNYPWEVVAGGASGSSYCMKSTNAGVASSESAIEATVEYAVDGTVSFDANCQGEGTSTAWDKCRFFIDGTEKFSYGAHVTGWNNYSFDVTAGTHVFTWSYSKDSSVNPTGDCMMVDNIVFDGVPGGSGPSGGNGLSEIVWSNIIDKDMNAAATFNIALNSNQSPAGATMELVGPDQTYNVTFDETATYAFESIRRGSYGITVELAGYATLEDTIMIESDGTYDILLEEVLGMVENLYVSPTGWAMWDDCTATNGTTVGNGSSINGGGSGGSGGGGGGGGGGGSTGASFTEGFENGLPTGWNVIDANSDGYTWCLTSAIPSTWTYYSSVSLDWYRTGTNAICSGSYINGVGALTPDEYLVTPQVTLASGSTFSFWAAACDASYPADHFGVFVSDNGTSGWTSVQEWTLTGKSGGNDGGRASRDGEGAKLGTWYNYTVDLSSYAGDKYIAIRHFNCNDQYIMCVDDLELSAGKGNRTALRYKVEFEGQYEGETDNRFWQCNVDNLNEGDVVLTRVAAVYATGMSEWAEYEWVYTPCDNFEGATDVTATENIDGTAVELSWTMPEGGITPPPSQGEWYYYDNGANEDAIGLNGGGSFYWGVMFPAGSYNGNQVTKVAMFDYSAHTGNILIYQGGSNAPGTLIGTQAYTCTGSTDFVEWTLSSPVSINPSQNLWIVMCNNDGGYVASCSANTGDANGRWISLDGSDWADVASYGLSYTWMIRAYIAGGGKDDIQEVTAPAFTPGTGTLANAGVAMGSRDMWDLVGTFNGTSAGQQAVATDGNYIYTASWQSDPTGGYTFYQYDLNGNFIEGFNIAGATGIRDLTTDGEYFYGTSGSSQIFILDFTNRTLVGTINCSGLTSRHISYDPERDGFWCGNWTTLTLYSRTGTPLQSAAAPENAYGSAYYKDADNVEHLYMFCQPNSDAKVYDYNIGTNTFNGPVFDFAQTPGFNDAIAGGCFIGSYDGKTCWFGNAQQDPNLIGIYEIDGNGSNPPTPTGGILGALVYRDGELLTPAPISATTYVDEDMEIGEHEYCIRVVYSDWSMSCMECAEVDYTSVVENDVVDNLYPNPTRDLVTIEAQGMNHITVVSTLGQVVYDADVNGNMIQLNLGQFKAGLYLVRVSTQAGVSVKRVTVVK